MKHPRKYRIRKLTNLAIKLEFIKRKYRCEHCGKGGSLHIHHKSYTTCKDIEFLCSSCHQKANHKRYNKIRKIWLKMVKGWFNNKEITEHGLKYYSKARCSDWKKFYHKYLDR